MQLNINEAVYQIEHDKHAQYDPTNPRFDVFDQLLACQSIAESTPIDINSWDGKIILGLKHYVEGNVSVNGSVNDSCKQQVNSEKTLTKLQAIAELRQCNHKSSRKKIAELLKIVFSSYESKSDHWLFIAQHWNPRAINRVIQKMTKLHSSGRITIKNPSAYFTFLIKKRKQRKDL